MRTTGGRPSVLSSQQEVQVLLVLLNEGMSKEEIINRYGINPKTFKRWCKKIGGLLWSHQIPTLYLPRLNNEDTDDVKEQKVIRTGKLLDEYLRFVICQKDSIEKLAILLQVTDYYRRILASLKAKHFENLLSLQQKLYQYIQAQDHENCSLYTDNSLRGNEYKLSAFGNCSLQVTDLALNFVDSIENQEKRQRINQDLTRFQIWFSNLDKHQSRQHPIGAFETKHS